MRRRVGCAAFLAAALMLTALPVLATAGASARVVNGDFETGTFVGFTQDGVKGGVANIAEEGTCFSFWDTTGITFSGRFAANVRSSSPAPINSVGIPTSEPFVAGPFVAFEALSESANGIPDPVHFKVRILTAGDDVLSAKTVTTNIIQMAKPCGTGPQDAAFSQHVIDTSTYLGQSIKIQFRQHTNVAGQGFFTLVDNIMAPTMLFAELSGGATEVPNPGDPDGSGAAQVTVNPRKQRVCFAVAVINISLPAEAMHIHEGEAGAAGDIVVDLKKAPVEVGDTGIGLSMGCVRNQFKPVLKAIKTNPDQFYVNVHTADFPGGAVRGQLEVASGPP